MLISAGVLSRSQKYTFQNVAISNNKKSLDTVDLSFKGSSGKKGLSPLKKISFITILSILLYGHLSPLPKEKQVDLNEEQKTILKSSEDAVDFSSYSYRPEERKPPEGAKK